MSVMLSHLVDYWRSLLDTFFTRLANDRDSLAATFGAAARSAQLTDLRGTRGDPHLAGRVLILEFESGLRCLYKPRDLWGDAVQSSVIGILERSCIDLKFVVPRLVLRGSYGWSSHVAHEQCEDVAAAERYFACAGALLALSYLLNSVDLHHENVLATALSPVIVDAEALLYPQPGLGIFDTGLLPAPEHAEGQPFPTNLYSGLAPIDGVPVGLKVPVWIDVNRDDMRLAYREASTPRSDSGAQLDDVRLCASRFEDSIIRGFQVALNVLRENWRGVRATIDDARSSGRRHVRYFLRPTQYYALVSSAIRAPDTMHSPESFSRRCLEFLSPEGLPPGMDADACAKAESRALEAGLLPSFSVELGARDVLADDGARVGMVERDSLDCLQEKFVDPPHDEAELVQAIRASLKMLRAISPRDESRTD